MKNLLHPSLGAMPHTQDN